MSPARRVLLALLLAAALAALAKGIALLTHDLREWPRDARAFVYASPADGRWQPALLYTPPGEAPTALLVALHPWRGAWDDPAGTSYLRFAMAEGWAFVHPHFRGPNRGPDSTGSDAVVADIVAAVAAVRARRAIDPARIYVIGESGGGHAALLAASRAPGLFAAVSAWVPVSDLARFHAESRARGLVYADHIEAACGGVPAPGSAAAAECARRSPLTSLAALKGTPVDINAGIRDATVPVGHSLMAFNALAEPAHVIGADNIAAIERDMAVPPWIRFTGKDPLYGENRVLFRRHSGAARVTLFAGGHRRLDAPAFAWLRERDRERTAK